jgi:hypothetical protein
MHPVWEKLANAVEKDFSEENVKEEACTRRMGFWGAILLAGLIAAGGLYGTLYESGYLGGPSLRDGVGGSSFTPPSDRPGNGG